MSDVITGRWTDLYMPTKFLATTANTARMAVSAPPTAAVFNQSMRLAALKTI